jgi:anti-sigma regulatory factor (Ser/Thr protein kinase)
VGALPFVTEGLRQGVPTLVAVSPDEIDLLRRELGDDARHVRFEDMHQLGRNPARIIPAWREFVDAHDGVPLRGLGEPIWPGRHGAEVAECHLHEALLNLAFADREGLELLCPYDVNGLSSDVIDDAQCTHPVVSNGHREQTSGTFGSLDAHAIFTSPLPPPSGPFEELRFGARPLHDFREFVGKQARRAGVVGARVSDAVLAANEIASNSLLHGGGAGVVRTWREGNTFLCEIRDQGHIEDVLVGRVHPSCDETTGRGVWMANELCDLVQLRSSASGTTVRLHVRVDPTR